MYDVLTESDFRKKIKPGIAGGIPKKYFFYGDEDYLKKYALSQMKSAFVADASFDYNRFDGLSYTEDAFADALSLPPMFGECRLVDVSLSPADLKPSEMNALISLMGDVPDDGQTFAVLSFPSGSFDPGYAKRPSSLFKKLAEVAVPVNFERVTGARLNGWVGKHYSGNGVSADGPVCAATVALCGTDMMRLSGETDKISWYVLAHGRDRVTLRDVEEAGSRNAGTDAFALANAVVTGDRRAALSVLAVMRERQEEPVSVMSEIIRVICDVAEVFACRQAGMAPDAISSATGIKPYPLSKYLAAADRLDRARVRALLFAAKRADEGVKGSFRDYRPIEQFLCSF